jgi:hypothetical protein
MLLPEVLLYNTLNAFLGLAAKDWTDKVDKTTTLLYDLFKIDDYGQTIGINNYDYYTQAVALLVRNVESVRKTEIYIGYNPQKIAQPSVHILMPSDSKGRMDSVSDDQQTDFDEFTSEVIITKTKSSSSTYHLMMTSDNSSEVMIMYYFFKAMCLLFSEHLELNGLRAVQFSGADINVQNDLVPINIYHRNLALSSDYEFTVKLRMPAADITGFKIQICADIVIDNEDFRKEFDANNRAPLT